MYVVKRQKNIIITGTISPQRRRFELRQWKERYLKVNSFNEV